MAVASSDVISRLGAIALVLTPNLASACIANKDASMFVHPDAYSAYAKEADYVGIIHITELAEMPVSTPEYAMRAEYEFEEILGISGRKIDIGPIVFMDGIRGMCDQGIELKIGEHLIVFEKYEGTFIWLERFHATGVQVNLGSRILERISLEK